mmetsp:Transcript_10522/g.15399  ORF Transcript_10522/g.15399 Transcript_10522/m.15399 type:complete len:167 (-) Transcript_10522:150-650(-)
MFLNSFCCPQILMGQIMTRMKLDWLGHVTSDEDRKKTFRNVFTIVVVYFLLSSFFSVPEPTYAVINGEFIQTSPPASVYVVVVNNLLNLSFWVYFLVAMTRTRRYIRERYSIPEERCNGYEDVCCAMFCGCCTVAQMAQHTANYPKQRALCCSSDGLPRMHQVMIV